MQADAGPGRAGQGDAARETLINTERAHIETYFLVVSRCEQCLN